MAMLRVIRGALHHLPITKAWQDACLGTPRQGCACPSCQRDMVEVRIHTGVVEVDICPRCQAFWLDRGEWEKLPSREQSAIATRSIHTRKPTPNPIVAGLKLRKQLGEPIGDDPKEPWKEAIGVLGLPVEIGRMTPSKRPWMTWSFLLIVAAAYWWASSAGLPQIVQEWGFLPESPWRHGGLTWVAALFLHAGIWHLIGNLYFWFLTGDNVEDVLGRTRYLLLILAGAIGGNLLHLVGDPRPGIPCVGASHAISALMAFYVLSFPKAQIGIPFFRGAFWLRLPAWGAFLVWLALQIVLCWRQIGGFGNVSALAHIGGVIVGVVLWWWWIGSQGRQTDDT